MIVMLYSIYPNTPNSWWCIGVSTILLFYKEKKKKEKKRDGGAVVVLANVMQMCVLTVKFSWSDYECNEILSSDDFVQCLSSNLCAWMFLNTHTHTHTTNYHTEPMLEDVVSMIFKPCLKILSLLSLFLCLPFNQIL